MGALVSSIFPDSPAQSSGMKAGDVIIKFDGKEVKEMSALPRIVAETDINKPVEVEVWRGGRSINLKVIIGEMKEQEEEKIALDNGDKGPSGDSKPEKVMELGLLLSNITSEIRNRFNIPDNLNGVIVVDVESGSDASTKGILPGDIIMEVAQNKVYSVYDVKMRILAEINASRDFTLLLLNRKGELSFLALKIQNK